MSEADARRRHTLRAAGQVQGVGFRPFVWRLAHEIGLSGSVRNDPAGVTIEVEGGRGALLEFARRIRAEAPPLARVDTLTCEADDPAHGADSPFEIIRSDHGPGVRGRVTVDSATCDACLAEMRDPTDRRHGHALINCTNCGPRYTIVRDLPYDRPLTTMAPYPMCPVCEAEYRDPADRRFHAQPTCCLACGPRVRLVGTDGREIEGEPFRTAAALLRRGAILAVKGLGGYHLVVDASQTDAVARLRAGKRRDHKPFAVMAADLASARALVDLSEAASEMLASPARPIVLGTRRPDALVAAAVAPGNHRLGVMLPYTPMQHRLFDEGLGPLVMTSANHSDDPLLKDDAAVDAALGEFCDATLLHDRAIERAVDDSILLDGPRGILPLRRARGYVPQPLRLPVAAREPGLCVGGELKNTVAIVRGDEVVLSQHLGDLSYSLAWERFEETVADLRRLFDVTPRWIACDAHPDYQSRRWAREQAAAHGLELVEVQHHHAHLASLLAESGRTESTIGIVCDGVGYGTDGTAWGGEILVGDCRTFERWVRLRPTRLAGGDAAARETGRVALAWLVDGLGSAAFEHPMARAVLPDPVRRAAVSRILAADVACPPSSGLGRLFDAIAALLGVCSFNHHEAMSGMRLESLAATATERPSGAGVLTLTEAREGPTELDHRPLLTALLARIEEGVPQAETAFFAHDALAHGLFQAALETSRRTGVRAVGLTGGVFGNALLTELLATLLQDAGMEVLTHRTVPPNDGGIAFGQAAVAAARRA